MVTVVAFMGTVYGLCNSLDDNGRTLLLQLVSEPIYSSHERYNHANSVGNVHLKHDAVETRVVSTLF